VGREEIRWREKMRGEIVIRWLKNRVREVFKSHGKNGEKMRKLVDLDCKTDSCEENPYFTHASYRKTIFYCCFPLLSHQSQLRFFYKKTLEKVIF
jgi:hypothetical protein